MKLHPTAWKLLDVVRQLVANDGGRDFLRSVYGLDVDDPAAAPFDMAVASFADAGCPMPKEPAAVS